MPPRRRHYHHGDLPNALRAATAELISEVGPLGFSLREVARRAGVSHAAPAHHFGDRAGLLTAVAIEGLVMLREELTLARDAASDPVEQLIGIARAYLRMALARPGHFVVMVRQDLLHEENPELQGLDRETFDIHLGIVSRLLTERGAALDPFDVALQLWSTIHGVSQLYDRAVALGGTAVADAEDLVELFIRQSIEGIRPARIERRRHG